MAYVDIEYVKLHSGAVTPEEILRVEAKYPGFVGQQCDSMSRRADGLLMKRYATPIAEPVPEEVRFHVAKLVAKEVYVRHGGNPPIEKSEEIKQAALDAWAFFRELATAKDSLIDLPLREGDAEDVSDVTKAVPLGSSQVSAYEWTDVEAAALNGSTAGFDPQ